MLSDNHDALHHQLALIALEKEEDFRQYRQYVMDAPLGERRRTGHCWFPVRCKHTDTTQSSRFSITIERTSQLDAPLMFQSGASVAVFAREQDKNLGSVSGTVASVWPDQMKIHLHTEEIPDWIDEGKMGVDLLFDSTTYQEMERAIRTVIAARGNRLAALRDVAIGKAQARFSNTFVPELPQLNLLQNAALSLIARAQDIAIVHGPPGTGKTSNLVAAVCYVLRSEKQVLVTAPSNTAVDLLTEKLSTAGCSVLRVGHPARIDDSLQAYTLDARMASLPMFKEVKKLRIDAQNFRDMAHKYKRNFGAQEREQRKLLFAESRKMQQEAKSLEQYLTQQVLEQTQVVTATLVGCASELLADRQFGTVFIDEAGQALEGATWIPFTKAAGRVVLAGDHCQLPPTVKSVEAERAGLGLSLFEKIIDSTASSPLPVAVMLEEQYRMNAQIMAFPSETFYHNRLKAAPSVADWNLAQMPPLLFIDTAGCGFTEKTESETGSTFNEEEAALLVRHFMELAETLSGAAQGVSAGVISPYKAQVKTLAAQLKGAKGALTPDVNTIDSFQGQERDIIYISLVRSNDNGQIGFLKDIRRMNVAMTRARKRLVIVGDSATVGSHPFYKSFIDKAMEWGTYQSAWELIY